MDFAAFDNTYARLPEAFFTPCAPTPVREPRLLLYNEALARELGLATDLDEARLARILGGNAVPEGAQPISAAYAGHQFGQFVPSLGDGRAILLGEVVDAQGRRRDIQLKGAGRTPYSRRGDGRAALGPVLREFLVGEAMHALGIPSTRALAAVATGEWVVRERGLPGAIFTRVAASHVRVGSFEYFAARGDLASLRRLVDYVVQRHDPQLREDAAPVAALLTAVARRQARLVARWMAVGFVHGVMNTDNVAVSGETLDFGPCAFLEEYDPNAVFSSIDESGRYAYGNQGRIAWWNMLRLAEALLPLLDEDEERAVAKAQDAIGGFPDWYQQAWREAMRAKLGLDRDEDEDLPLIQELLEILYGARADFTLSFRRLADLARPALPENQPATALAALPGMAAWLQRWHARLAREGRPLQGSLATMRRANPAYIPRNHRIERALAAAIDDGDLGPARRLAQVLARPYEEQPGFEDEALPAAPHERVLRTFCGT